MTHRERFFALLAGESIDRPPFFPDITNWYVARRTPPGEPRPYASGQFIPDDAPLHRVDADMPPEFREFTLLDFYRRFDWGLPVHIYNWCRTEYDGVERTVRVEGGRRITRLRGTMGELEKVESLAADGSWAPRTYFVKSVRDLEMIRYVVEHTHVVPDYDRISEVMAGVGSQGVSDVVVSRSPFGKLVHQYMGLEQVVYSLCDDREFCIPYYQKANRILHRAGKVVSTHLDGNHRGILPDLADTHFDLLDGCTPAPMTNYEVEELAQALPPTMSCYCGVPSTLFCQGLSDEVILKFGERILRAFDGRVILNVGDILPPNGNIHQVIKLGEMVKASTGATD